MHLYRAGQRNEPFLELFLNNVRLPEQVLGDLEAQCTANKVCCERAIDFLQDSGEADFDRLSAAVLEKADAAMRKAVSAIPDGRYESAIEADGIPGQPTVIRCAVTIDGATGSVYEGDARHTSDEDTTDEHLTELLGYLSDETPADHPLAPLRTARLDRA